MTNRERLALALSYKKTDRLCFSPLCDGYFSAGLPAQGFKDDLLAALTYTGCDILLRHAPCYREVYESIEVRTEESGGKYRTHYDTPAGGVYFDCYFKNGTRFLSKHLIESAADVRVAEYIARHTFYEPAFEEFTRCEELIGEAGAATATAPCSPVMEVLQVLAGIENATYLFMDEREAMDSLFSALHERNKRVYGLLGGLPSPYVFAYEDTSTTVLNLEWMNDYAVPYLNDYAELLHSAGKKYLTHMCGKLGGFCPQISRVRSDGIDSVCPPTTGDLTLAAARAAFPDKVLIGGIEPPSMVLLGRKQLLSGVVNTLNELQSKTGIVLSSGDAVPYGADINTIKAIADMLKELGEKSLEPGIPQAIVEKYL
jgi:hypothetical protein